MRAMLVAVWAIAAAASANAVEPQADSITSPAVTLLQKALGFTSAQREARPTGQCIVECEDRLITLKRCPDGECPDFDCRTGAATCGNR